MMITSSHGEEMIAKIAHMCYFCSSTKGNLAMKSVSEVKLRVVYADECRASLPGTFRAVVMLDSEAYQIEDDVSSLDDAHDLTSIFSGSPVQIFDHEGNRRITAI